MSAARLSRTNAKSSRVAHTGARWVACDGSSVMLIWWRGSARRDEREYRTPSCVRKRARGRSSRVRRRGAVPLTPHGRPGSALCSHRLRATTRDLRTQVAKRYDDEHPGLSDGKDSRAQRARVGSEGQCGAARCTGSRRGVESCARSDRRNLRNTCLVLPLSAFFETRALPVAVLGPVDCSHGRHFRINSARKRRCSGVL